eukprot:TRINITY_DN28953_c0_g1_i1.p1 TRINITY_DN28953_c0_g1~~TRINITY_DN28953_c0_g1_i1.p1  ORF type:complete len:272 (+),score=48.99 TRINITY_DN28953_c0_g1_i1:30-818(+)
MVDIGKCAHPECEHPQHPSLETYNGYCCDKCEARANGEEWAMNIKKMHSKTCTSKYNVGFMMGLQCAHPECKYMVTSEPSYSKDYCCGKCEELMQELGTEQPTGWKRHHKYCEKIPAAKCAHPDCIYRVNSNASVSEAYCCSMCEGLCNGEAWALSSTKRHYKNCEQSEIGKMPEFKKEKNENWDYQSNKKSRGNDWGAGDDWGAGSRQSDLAAAMQMLMMMGGGGCGGANMMMGNQGYNMGGGASSASGAANMFMLGNQGW